MILTIEQANEKCKLGQGEECCAFLSFSEGWNCLKGTSLESTIEQRLADGKMVAKGDYCKPIVSQKAIYTECGWRAEVEILEDYSDSEWYRYKLKVIHTHEEGMFNTPPDGHIFSAEADKKFMAYMDWRLIQKY